MTRVAAVICVRMSSTRLPGKALCIYDESGNKTNLQCIIERTLQSRHKPHVIIATSTDLSDNPIAEFIQQLPIPNWYNKSVARFSLYRGSLQNVVQRFDKALNTHCINADYVWRVMADCPLVDIGLVDWRIDVLQRNKADVITIIPPEPTYAAQASIWSKEAWDYCAKNSSGSMLEHPGEFIYENLGMFKTITEPGPESIYYQPIRTELDTPEDLKFFRKVWSNYPNDTMQIPLGSRTIYKDYLMNTWGVLDWLSAYPDIVAINRDVELKTKSTHLHGHHRARNWICKECGHVISYKVNDSLEVSCQRCGTSRRFYL